MNRCTKCFKPVKNSFFKKTFNQDETKYELKLCRDCLHNLVIVLTHLVAIDSLDRIVKQYGKEIICHTDTK